MMQDMDTHIIITMQDMYTHTIITITSPLFSGVTSVEILELPQRNRPSTTSQRARTLTCPSQLSLVEVEVAPRINIKIVPPQNPVPPPRVMSTNTLRTPH